MGELSARNFGLIIAYVLPGFVVLWGVSHVSEPVRLWLTGSNPAGPTVSGFLFVSLASVAAGMAVSAVRWAVVDTLHHMTGLHRPAWDDAHLHEKLEAYGFLVEIHYRYYQFYANTLIALPFAYLLWRCSDPAPGHHVGWVDGGAIFTFLIFAAASRDALRKYYQRAARLLDAAESEKSS